MAVVLGWVSLRLASLERRPREDVGLSWVVSKKSSSLTPFKLPRKQRPTFDAASGESRPGSRSCIPLTVDDADGADKEAGQGPSDNFRDGLLVDRGWAVQVLVVQSLL